MKLQDGSGKRFRFFVLSWVCLETLLSVSGLFLYSLLLTFNIVTISEYLCGSSLIRYYAIFL
ncbi:hypothetical protein [Mucilaginibacter gracilis]|uniref:hypothetical protein n=1 Tax=Mucilaginibacter gracilis TaxID=423350 RepID=UPI0011C37C2D|nr:hypothetical protein [Mucilaginibacter gracilis]